MPTPTPLQIVKEHYGSKEKLIEKVVSLVERPEHESEEEHKRRLRNVANGKLLHLVALGERAKALGGREGMIARILELKGQTKDHEYRDKLAKLTLGRLVDMVGSLERAGKRAGASARRARAAKKPGATKRAAEAKA